MPIVMNENSRFIYTIGHRPMLPFDSFVECLRKYDINCVVDIRLQAELPVLGDFCDTSLTSRLKEYGITYVSLKEEFAIADDTEKRKGKPVYAKMIKSSRFLRGIERLTAGVDKGYRIVLLGYEMNPTRCHRYLMIGRYLHEQEWDVCHIVFDGGQRSTKQKIESRILPQQSISESLERIETSRKESRTKSLLLGREGEEIAALYLMQNGYTILAKNWNLYHGCELDIIAFKDNILHAVEVKTRSSDVICSPEQAIDYKKMTHISKALSEYRWRNNLQNVESQIDSIAIVMRSADDYSVRMYENLIRRRTVRL